MSERRAAARLPNRKVHENRVRGQAERWGLRLIRTRQRDGVLVGTYGLYDDLADDWALSGPLGYGKSLEECEAYLRQVAREATGAANAG
jgi:hypothetical protein